MSRKIIITGGSGFIGKQLFARLIAEKYDVIILSRNIEGNDSNVVLWDGKSKNGWENYADGAYAIINLAGDNIGSGLWTKRKKKEILQSRINAGKAIIDAISAVKIKPKVVIQASGIGYYGDGGDVYLDENAPNGSTFLPKIAFQWENAINDVNNFGVRLAILRLGVVLGKNGGFLQRVVTPFKFCLGGYFGSGNQYISWIHLDDLVNIILFILDNENTEGVFNVCAPDAIKSKEFYKILGRVLHRPSFFAIPGVIIRLMMGEMGKELILSGQRAIPKKLTVAGFHFNFPDLKKTLEDILTNG